MTSQGDWQRDVFRDLRADATPQSPSPGGPPGPEAQQPPQSRQYADQQPQRDQQPQQPLQPQQPQPHQQSQQPQPHQRAQQVQQPPHQQPAYAPQHGAPQAAPRDQGHPPTPVAVPVVAPELAPAQGRARRGDSLPRRAGRALRRLVGSAADETTAETDNARAIQQPITTGRQIAVTSIRGGSGKSTTAALLALGFSHYRSDPVLAVEADPSLGTLPRRLGASEVRWSCADLVGIMHPSMRITDLTGYLVPFSGGWLLPASQGAVGAQLDVDVYRSVMTFVRRYFGVTLVDCESLPAEVARTALTTTQARVLVAPATVEGVAATRSVLDWIGGLHRSMLPTTVVVLSHTSPDANLDTRKAVAHLAAGGATVVELPYDRHLAAGGAISTALLGQGARAAVSRLAAAVMDRAVSRERRDRSTQPDGGPEHGQPQQHQQPQHQQFQHQQSQHQQSQHQQPRQYQQPQPQQPQYGQQFAQQPPAPPQYEQQPAPPQYGRQPHPEHPERRP